MAAMPRGAISASTDLEKGLADLARSLLSFSAAAFSFFSRAASFSCSSAFLSSKEPPSASSVRSFSVSSMISLTLSPYFFFSLAMSASLSWTLSSSRGSQEKLSLARLTSRLRSSRVFKLSESSAAHSAAGE